MNTTIVRKPAVTTSLTKQPKPQTTDHYHFGVLQTNRTTVVFYFRIWKAGTIDVTFDSVMNCSVWRAHAEAGDSIWM